MNNLQCRKAYVRVNLDVDEEGTIIPMLIRWKDGRVFQIEQLKYKCRASSNKVGGGGIRYTVMIRGKESFLFHEGDKWFVEAKENSPLVRTPWTRFSYKLRTIPRSRWISCLRLVIFSRSSVRSSACRGSSASDRR